MNEDLIELSIRDQRLKFLDQENSRTVPIVAAELQSGDYGLDRISFSPNDIVLDVGANVGVFSIFLAKLHPDIRIFAFEPLLPNYYRLCANLVMNEAINVVPFNFGISESSEFQVSYLAENPGASSEFHPEYGPSFNCKGMKLEELIRYLRVPSVKLLKIDCEGCEKYMANTDFKFAEHISIELHDYACDINSFVQKMTKSHGEKFWYKVSR